MGNNFLAALGTLLTSVTSSDNGLLNNQIQVLGGAKTCQDKQGWIRREHFIMLSFAG